MSTLDKNEHIRQMSIQASNGHTIVKWSHQSHMSIQETNVHVSNEHTIFKWTYKS